MLLIWLHESIELNCTIIFFNTLRQISVSSLYPKNMLTIVSDKQCRVYSCVCYEWWIFLIRCNEETILKTFEDWYILIFYKIFCELKIALSHVFELDYAIYKSLIYYHLSLWYSAFNSHRMTF